jgi:hypothetical protein
MSKGQVLPFLSLRPKSSKLLKLKETRYMKMKWTNTKNNLKNLGNDLKLTVVSPVLAIVDILKVPVEAVRDIQENAKAKKFMNKANDELNQAEAETETKAKPKRAPKANTETTTA